MQQVFAAGAPRESDRPRRAGADTARPDEASRTARPPNEAARAAQPSNDAARVAQPSDDAARAARALRDALGRYPTGVAVVATRGPDGRRVGLTVNSFASLSLDPPLVLWSLSRRSTSLEAFRACRRFAISVLAADQEVLARRFAAPCEADRFEGVALDDGHDEAPLIAGAVAQFVCAAADAIDGGDHVLFVGRVEHHRAREAEPLIFHCGRFRG